MDFSNIQTQVINIMWKKLSFEKVLKYVKETLNIDNECFKKYMLPKDYYNLFTLVLIICTIYWNQFHLCLYKKNYFFYNN